MAKTEFRVTNINKRGEVFDPSEVTIISGILPDLDVAINDLLRKLNHE